MKNNTSTTQPSTRSLPNLPTEINLHLGTDAVVIGGILLWALWSKGIWPSITKKLDNLFVPIEEERKLTDILSQIGYLTKASRVILAAFHNGSLDSSGYHLQKLSTVNSYTAPGSTAMKYPIKDLPIGRIVFEIEEMIATKGWVCVVYSEDLPQPCKDHLLRNDMKKMCNRLVTVGNLPIGILSLQYLRNDDTVCPSQVVKTGDENLMEDLYLQIGTIMRRRVIYPSPVHKIFGTLLGTVNLKK